MKTSEKIQVMQAFEDGKQIETKYLSEPYWEAIINPTWDWDSFTYRIKQEQKPVDLSVLIDSGIDCEFSNYKDFAYPCYGPLEDDINPEENYAPKFNAMGTPYCRPRMNHIHAWQCQSFNEAIEFRCKLVEAGFIFSFDTLEYLNGVVLLLWNLDKASDREWPWEME